MMRRIWLLLSLVAIGVGLFIIKTEHAKDAVCSSNHGQVSVNGLNSDCLTIVASYFSGFALVVIGSLAFISILALMKKRRRGG